MQIAIYTVPCVLRTYSIILISEFSLTYSFTRTYLLISLFIFISEHNPIWPKETKHTFMAVCKILRLFLQLFVAFIYVYIGELLSDLFSDAFITMRGRFSLWEVPLLHDYTWSRHFLLMTWALPRTKSDNKVHIISILFPFVYWLRHNPIEPMLLWPSLITKCFKYSFFSYIPLFSFIHFHFCVSGPEQDVNKRKQTLMSL